LSASRPQRGISRRFARSPTRLRSGRCHRITGEDCFFIKLHLRTIDDLERILDRFTPYGRTTTSLVHSSAVENRPLPMAAAD
jgi:hypothetical protein